MLLQHINGITVYPYNIQDLFAKPENKNLFIPRPYQAADLAAYGVFQVTEVPMPQFDIRTHRVEQGTPELVDGEWTQTWVLRSATPQEASDGLKEYSDQIRQYMSSIDDLVAERLAKSTRFSVGYQEREAAALSFKAAGYTGDATEWVTRFADNVGMTHKDATNLILSQANSLRSALKQLEALRMDKYLIQSTTSLQDARAKWEVLRSQIVDVIIP